MNIRGQFSDFFFETALPAMEAKTNIAFKEKPPVYTKLFTIDSTTKSIKQYSEVVGVGLLHQIGEAEEIGTDDIVQGFDKTLKPLKYGLGIACSRELVEDDKFDVVADRASMLGRSLRETIEIDAMSVFNNAFTGGVYAGPDGKALVASDHPLIKAGGTESNLLSTAADLSITSLELALGDWETMKTPEGFDFSLPTPTLLVHPSNRFAAHEMLKGSMRSDTANNTINAFRYGEMGPVDSIIVSSKLVDEDAWFLVAPPGSNGLIWLWRKRPYTSQDYKESTEVGYMYKRARWAKGFKTWYGVYGTPGAA